MVGTYPRAIDAVQWGKSYIDDVRRILDAIAPPRAAVHLLPFHPSSGDDGFAPDTIFDVDPALGGWPDIGALTRSRRVVVDGIYNHIGIGHPWVVGALESPERYTDLLHIYPDVADPSFPLSPRGGPVLRERSIAGRPWYFWQTFSAHAVDVKLRNPGIFQMIDEHLALLASKGAWGVRLDAAGYYAKSPGTQQFHHPEAVTLANAIATAAQRRGLAVTAQLDCDSRGLRYFATEALQSVTIVDYAFTAYLLLAILAADPEPLARHLANTAGIAHRLVRAPRNHDGVLLRPRLLTDPAKTRLIDAALAGGHSLRVTNGTPYELNSTLASLYGTGVGRDSMWRRIELGMTLTAAVSQWAYFYLPSILGSDPSAPAAEQKDPRAINRLPISAKYWAELSRGNGLRRVRSMLDTLSLRFDSADSSDPRRVSIDVIDDHGLLVTREDLGLRLLANFSPDRPVRRPATGTAEGTAPPHGGRAVGPLRYAIW